MFPMFFRFEANVANSQRGQRSSNAEMRFPDTALLRIFSYLDFSDILSCRLVKKQWHRLALDNISFVLRLQRVETKQSPRTTDSAAAADRTSDERYHVTLVPYPASLHWKAAETIALRAADSRAESKIISIDQLTDVVTNSFEQKVKHVIVRNAKSTILSMLPIFASTMPAATTICANNVGYETTRFVRETHAGDFKCIELDVVSIGTPHCEGLEHFFSNNASSIRKLYTWTWSSIKGIFDVTELRSGNNDLILVLDNCEELLMQDSLDDIPFREFFVHFPAIRKLQLAVGRYDRVDNIENLEQLANLTSLRIFYQSNEGHVLETLRNSKLVELRLGSGLQLPQDQSDIFLPAVTTLELGAGFENALRLSTIGVPILNNLNALTLMRMPTDHVKPFLRSALPVTPKLQSLTIDLILTSHLGRPVLTDIYDTLLAVPSCSAAITIGTFEIFPEAVNCLDLAQQRVADIKERNLKAAITIQYEDNDNNALVNTLEAGWGAAVAIRSDAEADNWKSFELTWRNEVTGIQQKLKIRVLAY